MLKRVFDFVVTLVLLVPAMPLMATIAVLVRFNMGAPVLFRQVRPGFKGRPFVLYKFRTMTDDRDEEGNLLSDEARLKPLGKVLRRYSLDELPQLFNVLKGDLSFVGPRPLLMEYLPLYSAEQVRRHDVRPGITGWAQVNGRNAINWEEKFAYDLWYVDHYSLLLDLKILWLTLVSVLTGAGISSDGHVTMPKFTGSSNDVGGKES